MHSQTRHNQKLRLRILSVFAILLSQVFMMNAQTVLDKPDLSVPSLIAPAFFGPNAFPVPDMLDGTISSDLKLETAVDGFFGTTTSKLTDDLTFDVFAKATIPLFSERVNLVIWMPLVEYFRSGPDVNRYRRVQNPETWMTGTDSGDAYVSTDILLLDETKRGIGVVVRAALKSASGNSFAEARVYDSPGYFFDVAAGRNVYRSSDDKVVLRVAVSTGFLCWQTDNGRQNDALMYGFLSSIKLGAFSARVDFGGYTGWEGLGDRPLTLKTKMSWKPSKHISVDAFYQYGFRDWPFQQIKIGMSYMIPLKGMN